MDKNTSKDTNKENRHELNLWELIIYFCRGIKKACIGLGNICGKMLQLTYQHCIVVIITLLLGFGAGLYFSRPEARYYEAGAMAWLNGPSPQMIKQISKQVELAFPKAMSEGLSLANLLGIPDDVAHNIRKIESFYVIDFLSDSTADVIDFKGKHSPEDTINVISPNHLYFRIQTKKVEQLPIYEKAFLNYLNTNPNVVTIYEKYNANQERLKQVQETELQRLDSLEHMTYLQQPPQSLQIRAGYRDFLIGEQRTQMLYKHIERVLVAQQKSIPYSTLCTAPVVLLDHFTAVPKAVNNRPKLCIIGICGGYVIGLLIALCINRWKKIIDYLRQK